MRKTYSFSLYENNEKDLVIIDMLDILPAQIRGKFIRSLLLKAIDVNKVGKSGKQLEKVNKKEVEQTEQTENTTQIKTEKRDNKINNPFEGLKI
jgi:Mor family transcriptional regulator